jgi:hypothetical protein
MLTLMISGRSSLIDVDLHRDRRVGTTESVTPEDLAVVIEATISLSSALKKGGHTRIGRYSFSVLSASFHFVCGKDIPSLQSGQIQSSSPW